jgi:hypothetical protein
MGRPWTGRKAPPPNRGYARPTGVPSDDGLLGQDRRARREDRSLVQRRSCACRDGRARGGPCRASATSRCRSRSVIWRSTSSPRRAPVSNRNMPMAVSRRASRSFGRGTDMGTDGRSPAPVPGGSRGAPAAPQRTSRPLGQLCWRSRMRLRLVTGREACLLRGDHRSPSRGGLAHLTTAEGLFDGSARRPLPISRRTGSSDGRTRTAPAWSAGSRTWIPAGSWFHLRLGGRPNGRAGREHNR